MTTRITTLNQLLNTNQDENNLGMGIESFGSGRRLGSLSPETLNDRDNFLNILKNRQEHKDFVLPEVKDYNGQQVIDSETIIEINNTTTDERRDEFIRNLMNQENRSENGELLIQNSSEQVQNYVNDLLIRASGNDNISEENFYRIGNIFLYSISSISGVESMSEVLESLRESMYTFNTNKDVSLISIQIPAEHSQKLVEIVSTSEQESRIRTEASLQEARQIGLRTIGLMQEDTLEANKLVEEMGWTNQQQIEQKSIEFQKKVDERIATARGNFLRRAVIVGGVYIGNTMLTSVGLPPVGVVNLAINGFSSVSHLLFPSVIQSQGIVEIVNTLPNFFI